ncbi:hypothetical protein J3R30DRAFT_3456399 [Lentinula aciculospora]|uniref:Uncharacterized protein n=1 Tax=Lentinula aciculospora TaxID=153920 RepID=A0A9W9DR05_9AGAR|nr:hypothetical protein J3R30DRAFT_3456399 [Lentinula aciculospora]
MEDPSKGEAGALCISKDHCLTVDFRSGIPEVIQIEAPTIPKGDTGFEINGTYFKDMGISAPLMIKASRQQFFEDVLNLAKLEGGNHTIKVDLDFLTLARNHTLLEDKDNYENIWSKFRTEIAEARKNHSSLVKFDALCQKESRNYRVGVYNLKEKYWRSWPGSGASYDVEPAAFCTGLRCLTVDSRTEPPKIIELPLA